MKKLILLIAVCTFGGLVNAQVEEDVKPCGIGVATTSLDQKLEKIFQKSPELRAQHEQMLELVKNSKKPDNNSYSSARSTQYVIPVVFHVLHMYGNENLDDAVIYQAIDHMNESWQHNDPDSVDIIPEFKQIAGGLDLEFRLANIDPYGNCTNGIEHIYNHETYFGDENSYISQWDRSHYLNIYVCASLTNAGASAYSIYPEGVDGFGFINDGIMARSYAVLSETTLAHEAGHWMNLGHVWNYAAQSDPGQICGDDGVADTPVTKGHGGGTCSYSWLTGPACRECDTLVIENAQNYMDYTGCGRMFTQGQMVRAENALNSVSGQRNIIWQDSTLALTGTHDTSTVQMCAPVADFNAASKMVCVGGNTTFTDHSWNAVIDNRTWTFQDGTPATSSNPMVSVTFTSPGWKAVTLEVSNAAGSDTKTMTDYIYVSPDWADFTGPAQLDIEGNQDWLFVVENPEDNWGRFQAVDGVGYDGSRAFKLNNYKDVAGADFYTDDYYYNERLGGSVDYLVTPSFDLRNTTNVTVGFWYSYATNASQVADITDVLKVYSSQNCGESKVTRKTIQGTALVTGGFAGNTDYTPQNNQMWEYAEFTYTPNSQDNRTRFVFEFEASDLASNLYIDNINVNGTLSLVSEEILDLELVVFPNPTKGEAINVRYTAQNEAVEFILRDMTGKVISTETVNTTNATVTHQIEGSANLPSAPYFLEVRSGDYSTTKKIVVL